MSPRIRNHTLIPFCQRVGNAIRAGIEARRLWETEARYGSSTHKHYVETIRQHVAGGDTVADGMRACEGYFPPLVCEMVEVGERTGQLDKVFLKLADHFQHQQSLTRSFLIGIAWPSLQLAMGIFVIGVLIAILGGIGAQDVHGNPIDVLGIGLTGVTGMLTFWGICALVLAGIVTAVIAVMRGWLGPTPVMLAMRIPMLGGALSSLALARLTWSLAMAFDAGIDARRSVEMAIRASQNPYYQSREAAVSMAVVRNRQFHEAFAEAGVYPDDFLQMLETAEIAGTTSESMQMLCREYEERAKSALKWLTWLTGIGLWIFIGGIMVVMIFRLAYLFLFKNLYDVMEMTKPGNF
ncbi:MAG TPA: type II secretion system F family protein [Pirellulaceae bacterium]|nr:type II secretion system F family protein [Pirellulaceae bacterium]